jgi:Bacteriocin-protection, YdeI or OmpD-Associated/Domain of unknown function (DUF1905)
VSPIRFEAQFLKVGSTIVLRLPERASVKLPSRGMVVVDGTISDFHFQAALEPDGKGSHWLKVDKSMLKAAHAHVGDTTTLAIEPSEQCPEPKVPVDLKSALAAAPLAHQLWMKITPLARWDWIRWIGATKNPETRKRRIEVTLSKFRDGKRRPCCFDRTKCTDPSVSSNGVLLEPTQV